MSVYVALLRGVNVAGQKPMKMQALVASLESLGLQNVKTVLQSGNAVFDAPQRLAKNLAERLSGAIQGDFGYQVPVVLRSRGEIERTVRGNPFLKEKGMALDRLYVTFLAQPPSAEGLKKLTASSRGDDRFYIKDREVYLYCPKTYGRSKLSNNVLERLLSVDATTRNWKTVNTLLQLAMSRS